MCKSGAGSSSSVYVNNQCMHIHGNYHLNGLSARDGFDLCQCVAEHRHSIIVRTYCVPLLQVLLLPNGIQVQVPTRCNIALCFSLGDFY